MLSKWFKNTGGSGKKAGTSSKSKGKDVQNELVSVDNYTAAKDVTNKATRELFKYDAPEQSLGMSDLIKGHKEGDRFLYAAVTGREEESRESKLRRLIGFTPTLNRRMIPINKLPVMPLFKEVEVFPISPLVNRLRNDTRPYVRIADAVVMYGSLTSTDAEFTKVKISIHDGRLMGNKCAKSMTATSNVVSKSNLSLSYCFPKAECDQISLTISREARFMEEGNQWGAIQVELQLEEMSFPMQADNTPVLGVNAVTHTLMEDHEVDPNTLDISITNTDRLKLAELYMSGDLADETEPVVNRSAAVQYAKSTLAGPKGKKAEVITSDWAFLANKRTGMMDADQASIEPSAEGSLDGLGDKEANDMKLAELIKKRGLEEGVALKSAMKNRQVSSDTGRDRKSVV